MIRRKNKYYYIIHAVLYLSLNEILRIKKDENICFGGKTIVGVLISLCFKRNMLSKFYLRPVGKSKIVIR